VSASWKAAAAPAASPAAALASPARAKRSASLGRDGGQELPHGGLRLRADELRHQRAVAEALHRGDALDAERLRHGGRLVDVHPGKHEGAGVLVREAFEHRPERAAGSAPRRPEVDHHRHRLRALEDLALEVVVADVEDEMRASGLHGVTLGHGRWPCKWRRSN